MDGRKPASRVFLLSEYEPVAGEQPTRLDRRNAGIRVGCSRTEPDARQSPRIQKIRKIRYLNEDAPSKRS